MIHPASLLVRAIHNTKKRVRAGPGELTTVSESGVGKSRREEVMCLYRDERKVWKLAMAGMGQQGQSQPVQAGQKNGGIQGL